WAPVRAPRQRRQDLPGARKLVGRSGRFADEQAAPARRVAGSLDIVRAADRDARKRGLCSPAAHPRTQSLFVTRSIVLDECHSDEPLAGLDGNSKFQRLVWNAPTAGRAASRAAGVSANGRELHTLTIDRDFDLLRIARGATRNVDFHFVLAIDREVA